MEDTTMTLTARARALADRTSDAYSYNNYGAAAWRASAALLLRRGHTEADAETILRSKWTRWAADMASDRQGWRYGRTTSADLARFLDKMPARDMVRLLAS
jgi:hypothetical protein